MEHVRAVCALSGHMSRNDAMLRRGHLHLVRQMQFGHAVHKVNCNSLSYQANSLSKSSEGQAASNSLDCEHFRLCNGCAIETDLSNPPQYAEAQSFFKARGMGNVPMVAGPMKAWRCRAKLAVRGTPGRPKIATLPIKPDTRTSPPSPYQPPSLSSQPPRQPPSPSSQDTRTSPPPPPARHPASPLPLQPDILPLQPDTLPIQPDTPPATQQPSHPIT
eukprot:gene21344-28279_t